MMPSPSTGQGSRFGLDSEGVQQFEYHVEEILRFSTHRITARFPELYADGGAFGSDRCREELTFLLEFIRPALVFGIHEPLDDCLRWLSSLLMRRGLPTTVVFHALQEMESCLARYLCSENRMRMSALFAHATCVLEDANASGVIEAQKATVDPVADQVMQALVRGDRHTATALLEEAIEGGDSLAGAEHRLLEPALYEVGKEWHANRLTVAEEHLASSVAQDVMAQLLLSRPSPAPNGMRSLFAAPPGNRHVIGLRMIADAFEMSGWSVQFLGADVPRGPLLAQIREFDPHLVGLTVSLPRHLWILRELIEEIRQVHSGQQPLILVGGLLFNRVPSLATVVGADLWAANACDALERVSGVVLGP